MDTTSKLHPGQKFTPETFKRLDRDREQLSDQGTHR